MLSYDDMRRYGVRIVRTGAHAGICAKNSVLYVDLSAYRVLPIVQMRN